MRLEHYALKGKEKALVSLLHKARYGVVLRCAVLCCGLSGVLIWVGGRFHGNSR